MRVYDSLESNILEGLDSNETTFFITLTSSCNVDSDIVIDFEKLIKELYTVYKKKEIRWFAVFTKEGNGVIHLLVVNCFLPKGWFENKWGKIHHSYLVRKVEVYGNLGMSRYMKNQSDIFYVKYSDNWFNVDCKSSKRLRAENCSVSYDRHKTICIDCTLYRYCMKQKDKNYVVPEFQKQLTDYM